MGGDMTGSEVTEPEVIEHAVSSGLPGGSLLRLMLWLAQPHQGLYQAWNHNGGSVQPRLVFTSSSPFEGWKESV